MNFRKTYYLITLAFSQVIQASHNYRAIDIINKTNLPVSVRQSGREIILCEAFGTRPIKVLAGIEVACLVSKRKHRASCEPITLIPTDDTTSFKFYRDNNHIIAERIETDYSSEEID